MMISKPQMCLITRNGVEIWLDSEIAKELQKDLEKNTTKGFFRIEGRTINSADVVGIVIPQDVEDLTRRKNNQWKCKQATWHDRGEKCTCATKQEQARRDNMEKAIQECGKCRGGFIDKKNEQGEWVSIYCQCILNFIS